LPASRSTTSPDADAEIVADLRDALGRYPADEQLAALVDDLRTASPRFAELWRGHPIKRRMASRLTGLGS
jgi:hypothetical protein